MGQHPVDYLTVVGILTAITLYVIVIDEIYMYYSVHDIHWRFSWTSRSIEMLFNVTALQIETQTKNCDSICVMIGIPMDECDEYCVPAYKRYLQAGVMHAKATLEAIYADPDRLQSLMFHAAGREFEPDSFSSTEPGVDCAPGMRHVGSVCSKSICIMLQTHIKSSSKLLRYYTISQLELLPVAGYMQIRKHLLFLSSSMRLGYILWWGEQ